MAPTRAAKRKSDATLDLKVPVKTSSPSTPQRSPIRKRRGGITLQQKQAMIDNLQLESTTDPSYKGNSMLIMSSYRTRSTVTRSVQSPGSGPPIAHRDPNQQNPHDPAKGQDGRPNSQVPGTRGEASQPTCSPCQGSSNTLETCAGRWSQRENDWTRKETHEVSSTNASRLCYANMMQRCHLGR